MNKQMILEFLQIASSNYYKGSPLIPDEVYDRLEEVVGNKNKVFGSKDGDILHTYPLFSQQKFYLGEDTVPDFTSPTVETVKLDGASVALTYIDGVLVNALTRGDGKTGKDILEKMSLKVPTRIDELEGVYQVQAEVVAPSSIKNARNYAAGALNLKDLEEFKTRDLTVIVHNVTPSILGYYSNDLDFLFDAGFNTVTHYDCSKFPSDGLVIRLDDYALYSKEGFTGHHPRGAYALKTRKPGIKTILKEVIWQVGKSGKVSPVAIFDPIDIDGATVSRATLHNKAFIESLELNIGDEVLVIRSGEIIPAIVGKAN